jgi:hypothetical protein
MLLSRNFLLRGIVSSDLTELPLSGLVIGITSCSKSSLRHYNFIAVQETRSFSTAFTERRNWALSWANYIVTD